ncbi:MAG: DUF3570 domain-containing protein [Polyangiaceae bacterium]
MKLPLAYPLRLLAVTTALGLSVVASPASAAGENDSSVRQILRDIYDAEIASESYLAALENLQVATVVCEGGACSKQIEAELLIAIGTVQALLGDTENASATFKDALNLDAKAKLRKGYDKGDVLDAWQKAAGGKSVPSGGCRKRYEGGKTPAGWANGEAQFCYASAREAQKSEDYAVCHEDAAASVELEDRLGTRDLLARCLEADDKWSRAIDAYRELSELAKEKGQFTLGGKASTRAAYLQRRMPSIVLQAPEDVQDLQVEIDGESIAADALGSEMSIDPGAHDIIAKGTRDGLPLGFEQSVKLEAGRSMTLLLTMTPGNPDEKTRSLLKCLAEGKTAAECLDAQPGGGSGGPSDLKWTVGSEVAGYHDTMSVDVVSPSVHGNMEHVTGGWGLGASFLVDVVTAASVDIVATASPRWQEVRYAPALNGHVKFAEDWDIAAYANVSKEPDYLATSFGAVGSVELSDKMIVPSLGYEFSYDINARAHTSWSTFNTKIARHAITAGVGLVLTKATFGSINTTTVVETGDTSKPYRHIPMFSAENAPLVGKGTVVDTVNLYREPERPLEQLPKSRKRFAVSFGLNHRFASSTLRVSERLYADSWGVKATTTDARFMWDVLKELTIWPHGRLHAQTGASFYQLAYVVERTADGISIPAIRTGDRELGPLVGLTGGAGARYAFGAERNLGVSFNGDIIYTLFLNHLFVKQRLGYFGALGFDAEFE